MSNFKSGIFDYLGDYLNLAFDDCVGQEPHTQGVDNCKFLKKNNFEHFYMAKYYNSKSRESYNVPYQFVHAVVKYAKHLRNYDNFTEVNTHKKLLCDEIKSFFDANAFEPSSVHYVSNSLVGGDVDSVRRSNKTYSLRLAQQLLASSALIPGINVAQRDALRNSMPAYVADATNAANAAAFFNALDNSLGDVAGLANGAPADPVITPQYVLVLNALRAYVRFARTYANRYTVPPVALPAGLPAGAPTLAQVVAQVGQVNAAILALTGSLANINPNPNQVLVDASTLFNEVSVSAGHEEQGFVFPPVAGIVGPMPAAPAGAPVPGAPVVVGPGLLPGMIPGAPPNAVSNKVCNVVKQILKSIGWNGKHDWVLSSTEFSNLRMKVNNVTKLMLTEDQLKNCVNRFITYPSTATATATATGTPATLGTGLYKGRWRLKSAEVATLNSLLYSVVDKNTSDMTLRSSLHKIVDNLKLQDLYVDLLDEPVDKANANKITTDRFKHDVCAKLNSNVQACFSLPYLTANNTVAKNTLTALKENRLDSNELKLFDAYFELLQCSNNNWVKMNLNEFSNINTDKANEYRFNIKKTTIGSENVPALCLLIPKLDENNRYLVLPSSELKLSDMNFNLRTLFNDVFLGKQVSSSMDSNLQLSSLDMKDKRLRFNMTQVYKDRLAKVQISSFDKQVSKDTDSMDSRIKKNKWKRMSDGSYVALDDNNNSVTYKEGDDVYDNLVNVGNNCSSTYVFPNDMAKCEEYLDAIYSGDSSKLVEYMKSGQFNWSNEVEKINNVHPKLAYQTLKAYGFTTKLCNDHYAKYKILKIQSCDEFVKDFVKKNNLSTAVGTINTDLCVYLNLLVDLVNANPSVLNKNYMGESVESKGQSTLPQFLIDRNIELYKEPQSTPVSTNWSSLKEGLKKTYGKFSRGVDFKNLPFGNVLFPNALLGTLMLGGGLEEQAHETQFQFSTEIATTIRDLINKLKNTNNKSLSEEDLTRITKSIEKLNKQEGELLGIAKKIESTINIYSSLNNTDKETLTEEDMNELIINHGALSDKVEKSYDSLNTVITLLEQILKNTSNSSSSKDYAL